MDTDTTCTVCRFSPATEGERCLMCSAEPPAPEGQLSLLGGDA